MLPLQSDRSPLPPLPPRTLPAGSPVGAAPLGAGPLGAPGAVARRPGKAMGPAYRGLPRPLRFVLWVGVALVVGGVVGATAPTALERLGAVAALHPGLLAWYTVRTLGFLAYLVIAGSVVYGLLLSTKILDAIAHRPVSFALHKDLSIIGLVLATLHVVVLTADQSFSFTPRALLVPFASPYATFWVGIGQLSFYALAVITASFYVRRQIGQRAWRLVHYLTFFSFIGVTFHGIMSGSDSGSAWAFYVYLIPGASAVFLLIYRIAVSIAAHSPRIHQEVAAEPLPAAPHPLLAIPGGRFPSGRPAAPLEPQPLFGPIRPQQSEGPAGRENVRTRSAASGGLRWPT